MLTMRGAFGNDVVDEKDIDEEAELLCPGDDSTSFKAKEVDSENASALEAYFEKLVSPYSHYLEDRPFTRQVFQILSIVKSCFFSTLAPIAMLVLTFGVVYKFVYADAWARGEPVDRKRCRNSCFDGRFKGNYATQHYMSVYFNMDEEILPIVWTFIFYSHALSWGNYATQHYMSVYFNMDEEILPVVWTFIFYSHALSWVTSSAAKLAWRGRLDYVWALVFCFQLYPNFYNWWVMFNYHNERINRLYAQQVVFVWTEFLSSVCVCILANKANDIKSTNSINTTKQIVPLYIVALVSLVHIYVGGVDEFFHQMSDFVHFSRYWALTSTDVVPLIASLIYIHRQSETTLYFFKQLGCAIAFTVVFVFFMPSQEN